MKLFISALITKYEENLQEYIIDANFTDTGVTKIYVQNDDKKCEANITINRYRTKEF